MSRELRLNKIRDIVAHMKPRRVLALPKNQRLLGTPIFSHFRKAGAKVLLFFDMCKCFVFFFEKSTKIDTSGDKIAKKINFFSKKIACFIFFL